jgi:hypothetical protein
MKSRPLGIQSILATDHNTRRDDARGGSFLLAHQQLGALALPTNPTNGQTLTLTVNGTAIVITYVSSIGSTPNNILIQGTAALTAAATVNFLRRPDITNANQIAASVPNQALLVYLGWSLPSGATTLTPFSLNKNVNSAPANLTSFTASTTVTSGTWTAHTMQLYVEDGIYYVGTTRVIFAGASTPTVTAPVSNPRIDVLTADNSGTLAWTTGTENASPVAPTYPVGKVPICELYNVVGETALYDNENQQSGEGYIYNDVRPILGGSYISSTSQVASGLFILDPGSEAQGDILYYNGAAWVLLAPGSAGQVLQSGGASANPSWLTTTHSTILLGTGGGQYRLNGASGLVDVDSTNLKSTLSGLTVGNYVYIRCAFQYQNGGGGGNTFIVNLTDLTNSAVIWQPVNTTSALGNTTYQFEGVYKIPSTSIQFSLQWSVSSASNQEITNSSSTFSGAILTYNGTSFAPGIVNPPYIWIQTIT